MGFPHLSAVEFIGGPFDGFEHTVSFPPEELACEVTLPVNQNVLRMLEGDERGLRAPATSVAIYALEQRNGTWRYEFQGAVAANQLQCEGWQF